MIQPEAWGEHADNNEMMAETAFGQALHLEQKRSERSRRGFLLMLLDSAARGTEHKKLMAKIVSAAIQGSRETDVKGWYREGSVVGIIFTELTPGGDRCIEHLLLKKLRTALADAMTSAELELVNVSCLLFPDDWHDSDGTGPKVTKSLPEVMSKHDQGKLAHVVKRSMDIVGGLFALALFSPVMIPIAVAIKATSRGPVFFRQKRVGQFGRPFTFLKFRSMRATGGHAIHEEFVKRLIRGENQTENGNGAVNGNGNGTSHSAVNGNGNGTHKTVYKVTKDPRITVVGKFLRRTSLDELPQILNVLAGQMSLVGPRPPIPYEVAHYSIWHKRRLLVARPGITGLWQVQGRSRVKFDDMVRLDLRYARSWSLWLDVKILLQTPRAMISGDGAF